MGDERGDAREPPVLPGALQRARDRIFGGPETPWNARSRYGPPGRIARRLIHRAARPLEHRQHEIDAALFDAIREAGGQDVELMPALDLAEPIAGRELDEAATPIGTFWVDRHDIYLRPALLEYGSWQPEVAQVMQDRLEPTMTFVDVGANLGYFSVLGSQLVGGRGRVLAVEPDPENLELLRANLWRNRCFNSRVLPLAAWSEIGHVTLIPTPAGGGTTEVRREESGAHHIDARAGEAATSRVRVPCARLDDMVTPPVHLLKVDTQYTDHEVIRGAEATIAASPGITIVVEFDARELERRGGHPGQVLAYYQDLGFEMQLVEYGGVRPVSDEEIMSGSNLDLLLQRV
jgi:FkbM family methyltransferase